METLSTKRFRIDLLKDFHFDRLKKFALDQDLWKYSTIKINNEEDFKEYFNQALLWSEQTSLSSFAVYAIEQDEYIGMTRLYSLDSKNKSAKIGFTWYATDLQGSGVNTHCKYLILKYAFDQLGIERIELNADFRNKRSIAAMIKIGFQQEGILRSHIYLPDGYKRDTIVFSMLKNEWDRSFKVDLESRL